MPSENIQLIIGHAADAPKTHTTDSGQMVANFSVATSEKWKDKKSGEWREKTEWHRIVAWRWLAERAERDIKKGTLVRVIGKTETRTYEKDGIKHHVKEVIADTLYSLERRQKGEATDSEKPDPHALDPGARGGTLNPDGSVTPDDDDLPF